MAEADRADLLRMRRTPLLCLATVLSAGLLGPVAAARAQPATASAPATATPLQAIFSEAQALQRERPPALPLPAGADRRYSARMPFASEDYVQKRAARAASLLGRLKTVDQSKLSAADQLDVFIVSDRLQQTIAEAKFKTYLVPISDAGGFHVQFANDVGSRASPASSDYDEYIARLQSFKELTTAQIGLMRQGIAPGIRCPDRRWRPTTSRPSGNTLSTRRSRAFHRAADEDSRKHVPPPIASASCATAQRRSASRCCPPTASSLRSCRPDYLPKVRPTVGLSDVPGGREVLRIAGAPLHDARHQRKGSPRDRPVGSGAAARRDAGGDRQGRIQRNVRAVPRLPPHRSALLCDRPAAIHQGGVLHPDADAGPVAAPVPPAAGDAARHPAVP